MIIRNIVHELELLAAPELQEEYDNSGLLTGRMDNTCSGVLCALDVTREVIMEAVSKGINLIVAHHPIIFKGLKSLTGKTLVEQVIIDAIKNDIAIYAAHTNFDNIIMGVNQMIVKKIGLKDLSILQPKRKMLRRLITFAPKDKAEQVRKAIFTAGAGHIGNYSECSFNSEGTGTFKAEEGADPYVGNIGEQHHEKETKIEIVYPFYMEEQVVKALKDNHPYEEVAYDIFTIENRHFGIGAGIIGDLNEPEKTVDFLTRIKKEFNIQVIKHSELLKKTVQRIAVCGGSGSFLIKDAIRNYADVYVTSDIKYHEYFDAEAKIIVADIGHYESEQFTIELFQQLLLKKFPTFAILKTSINTNPVRYF